MIHTNGCLIADGYSYTSNWLCAGSGVCTPGYMCASSCIIAGGYMYAGGWLCAGGGVCTPGCTIGCAGGGIGTSSPGGFFGGGRAFMVYGNGGAGELRVSGCSPKLEFDSNGYCSWHTELDGNGLNWVQTGIRYSFVLCNGGNACLSGVFYANAKSFRIDHPHPDLNDTHELIHMSVESPFADIIYSGSAVLSQGIAVIDVDQESGMTSGTFEELCVNARIFTSNESDWDEVKGTLDGNQLTILCKNPDSVATVSWMVIAERHDQFMVDNDATDHTGRVIVERVKEPKKEILQPRADYQCHYEQTQGIPT